nr:hypothetical protein [Desertimonas flava]
MASAVILLGTVTCGAVVSTTVTVNEPFAVLPAASLAEQLTVVVAMGNTEPLTGEHETGRLPLTASLADAEKLTVAPDAEEASTVWLLGRLSTGGVVSGGFVGVVTP